jgi:hypothetical protein
VIGICTNIRTPTVHSPGPIKYNLPLRRSNNPQEFSSLASLSTNHAGSGLDAPFLLAHLVFPCGVMSSRI